MSVFFGFFQNMVNMNIPDCVVSDMYHEHFAILYDRVVRTDTYDLELYTEQASLTKGPILELGCGSGRVLLRLAILGFEITGIDNSPVMLNILEQKLCLLDKEIQSRVKYHNSDFRDLDIHNVFNLVIMPGATICSLKNMDEILGVFTAVYNYLNDGGRFIFDYYLQDDDPVIQNNNETVRTFVWEEPGSTKEFFIIGEKMGEDNSCTITNCYAEVISGEKTARYLGYSFRRNISTDDILNLIIDKTRFKIINTRFFKGVKNDKLKFVILQK